MEKRRKSKSVYYNDFLKGKEMFIVNIEHIQKAVKNIKRYRKASTALLSILYYTGARPDEVLKIRPIDINLYTTNNKKYGEETFLKIKLTTSKGGIERNVRLDINKPLVKEIYDYCKNLPPYMFMFYMYRGKYNRKVLYKNKEGIVKISNREEISDKLRYHFNIWFKGVLKERIPPYYLRHNRLTKLAINGATVEQLRLFKGAKDPKSVTPYLHQSLKESEKIARIND